MVDDGTSSPAPKRARSRKKKELSPNQAILDFLAEMEENVEGNFQFTLRRAIKSIKACPLPIKSRDDAERIKFVGDYLAIRIGAFLAANPPSENAPSPCAPDPSVPVGPVTKGRAKRDYIPRFRSGPYAILLALLEAEGEGHTFLAKVELGERAQKYADEPIHDKRGATKSTRYAYDGWSSVSRTLIPKNLVIKVSNPAKYSLTDAGRVLAARLQTMNSTAQGAIVDVFDPSGTPTEPTVPVAAPEPKSRARRPRAGLAQTSAPPPVQSQQQCSGFDNSQVLLVSQVVASLQAAGHPVEPCMDALKRVLDSGNVPRTEPALRALVLKNLADFSSPSTLAAAAIPAQAVLPATMCRSAPRLTPSTTAASSFDDVIVIHSDDGSETMDLIGDSAFEQPPAPVVHKAPTFCDTPLLPLPALSREADTVILILDSREKLGTGAARNCEKFAGKIRAAGVPSEIRTLPVGDAIFVRRCSRTGRDSMLDFVVERKTAADFASSVKDGRVLRQSYSMLHSSFARRLFVIEGDFSKESISEKELNRVHKTLAELAVFHGFFVKHTRNTGETVSFYASVHRRLVSATAATPIVPGETELFEEWSLRMSRFNSGLTLTQLFHLQLCQIPGVGRTRAEALVAMGYCTPADLANAFAGLSPAEGPMFLREEAKRRGLKSIPASVSEKVYFLFSKRGYATSMVEQ